jgi:hypothetical protein
VRKNSVERVLEISSSVIWIEMVELRGMEEYCEGLSLVRHGL